MTQQWQYKLQTYDLGWKGFDYGKIEAELNDLGRDGWEALGSIAPSFGSGQAVKIAVMLKKPLG